MQKIIEKRILITGWFSFDQMGASAGDIFARDLICAWLGQAGLCYEISVAAPFSGGVDWRVVDPTDYAAIIFICGPFGNGPPITEFMPKFYGIPLIGMNLSMLEDLDKWNPFDLLFERDSNKMTRPDLVFLTDERKVPVAGLILVHPQKEYGDRAMHDQANLFIQNLIDSQEMAVTPIDTRLDENQVGLRTAREVESLIACMDVVLTTRLHGMVLSLKNHIPPLVVDPIAGGAKIIRQARAIGWPMAFTADELDNKVLERALAFCLSDEGRKKAIEVHQTVKNKLSRLKTQFISGLDNLNLSLR